MALGVRRSQRDPEKLNEASSKWRIEGFQVAKVHGALGGHGVMNFVHVSDLHFGGDRTEFQWEQLKKLLVRTISELKGDTYLIVSGDITFKGERRGFADGSAFFDSVREEAQLSRKNILLCPGNHDCRAGDLRPFSEFSDFAYAIRRDNEFDFSDRAFVTKEIEGVYFLFVNSAFHLDHQYGLVDQSVLDFLQSEREALAEHKHRVLVVHHHLVNQYRDDVSAIRNAYPLLYALDECAFDIIFHGHQHSNQSIPVGRSPISMYSARSFNYGEQGLSNGLNICRIGDGAAEVVSYVICPDRNPTMLTLERYGNER